MALTDNAVRFEIFLERETVAAIRMGKFDPGLFPSRPNTKPEVPMKFWSPDHSIALEWFARAKKAGRVSLPPTHLLMASMPALRFLEHCLRGDIVIYYETSTCGFRKPVNQINYPGLEVDMIEIADNVAQRMLDNATEYLGS